MAELNHRGHLAEQRYAVSEANYRSAHGRLARIGLRLQQYIFYPLKLVCSLIFGRRTDIVVVCTNTFFSALLATFFHRRVVHLIYDLFPEALVHSGKLPEGALATRLIHKATQKTIDRAICNVYLGSRLKDYVDQRYRTRENCRVIAVGADGELFKSHQVEGKTGLGVLYCGNLGYMHDVDTLLSAWEKCPAEDLSQIHWRFHSSGPRYRKLKDAAHALEEKNGLDIEVGSGLKLDVWINVMKSAEVALVTMVPGSEEVVMPSKTYSAMCAGQAILAVAPEHSDLVDLIKEHDCGWWVPPGDVEGLLRIFKHLPKNPQEVLEKRQNAHAAGHSLYSQEHLAEEWEKLFREILDSGS
jgi:glycosyltransferase involved in cell wall biosynthesis